ncbi:MAG: hypothetical protein P1U56_15920 [Saprospiraceae bacterium]|nr:hypothetical protein [Saprospiraceae bacterium]
MIPNLTYKRTIQFVLNIIMSCFLVYFLSIGWALWVNVSFENTEAASIEKLKTGVTELRMVYLYQSGLIISFILLVNLLFQKLVLFKVNYKEVLIYALINLMIAGITISYGSQRTYSDLENIIHNNF